jgi:hypothetical protein
VTLSSGTFSCYTGGFAGKMQGSVKNSTVSVITIIEDYVYSSPISVTSKIDSGSAFAGGVTGLLTGEIERTVVMATVNAEGQTGITYGGGFAGCVDGGNIRNNQSNGYLVVTAKSGVTSSSEAYAGGLAGESNSMLSGNTLTGVLTVTSRYYDSSSYSGGLVGKLTAGGDIEASSVNGSVTIQAYSQDTPAPSGGTAYAGGLVGYSDAGCTITESSFTSSYGGVRAGFSLSSSYPPEIIVAAKEAYAGGIAGYAEGEISKVYTNAAFTGELADPAGVDARVDVPNGVAAAGGITGKNEAPISKSYAVVTVKARAKSVSSSVGASAGGISGVCADAISDTFALAQVDARPVAKSDPTSKAQAGGIAGFLRTSAGATVKTSYAAGSVLAFVFAGRAQAGGIAGYVEDTATVPWVEKCVALQKHVASDGGTGYHHRVVGMLDGSAPISENYAYEFMMSQSNGSVFGVTPNLNDENGDNIIAADAKDINFYLALGWNNTNTWVPSSNYPVLDGLIPPSVPSWATIP